jgi:beta-amylase
MYRRLYVLLVVCACLFQPGLYAAPLDRPAVMAPLVVEDWDGFNRQLQEAKAIGVTTVSTDVWWGKVEGEADQNFDWSYYDRVSDSIISAGLKWVPIFSFHRCGGNVGDSCDIPIPHWIWKMLGGDKSYRLMYLSEKGKYCREVVALWSDDQVRKQYVEFIQDFSQHFADKATTIEEINISAGPSGELRYPSYNQHDDFHYPERGYLQAYSDLAIADFARFAQQKYTSLDDLNRAWNTSLNRWDDIRPPEDAPGFFYRKDYLYIQYGKDFTQWYNQALLDHGAFMINLAVEALGERFQGTPLGIKIPGVHWLMGSPDLPRAAEVTTGLIPTHIDLGSDDTAHGYAPIIERIKQLSNPEHKVVLHFTCLEMDNKNQAPDYSLAKNLVFWVGNGAGTRDLAIMGENALSGGITNDFGWNNIDNAVRWSAYRGLTTLRLGNLEENGGLGFRRYEQLINDFKPMRENIVWTSH